MAESTNAPKSEAKRKLQIEPWMFWPPLILLILFSAFVINDPVKGNALMKKGFDFLSGPLGWSYGWFFLIVMGILVYLIFGKYGSMRFGGEKPEFSTFTWLVMLFTAATGGALLYWGTIEYFYYVSAPPFGVEPFSLKAQEWASSYGLFHWGFITNSLYALTAVLFGYFIFVKKMDIFRPSAACHAVLGDRVDGWLGKVIDIFYIIALVAGVGTSIGLATPLAGHLIAKYFHLEYNLTMDIVLIIIWSVIIAIAVYTGLQKGIKYMGLARIWLSFIVIGVVLLVGPASFMLNNFTDGIGTILQNFGKMALYTDPLKTTGFPQAWTIFYYAWYLTYAIYMGIYYARISRGRTVREVCLGCVGAASFGAWMFFAVIGNYATDIFNKGIVPVVDIMNNVGDSAAIVEVWSTLPWPAITLFIFLALAFVSTVTLLNGGAYTCAMATMKNMRSDEEPAGWTKIFWSLAIGAVTLALMIAGGLKPLQMFVVCSSFPMMIVAAMIIISFFKESKKGWGDGHSWGEKHYWETENS